MSNLLPNIFNSISINLPGILRFNFSNISKSWLFPKLIPFNILIYSFNSYGSSSIMSSSSSSSSSARFTSTKEISKLLLFLSGLGALPPV